MDDLEFDEYLKTEFLQEARELAELIESSLVAMESCEQPGPQVDEVFRYLHTIKGSSKAAGFNELGEFAHRTENVLSEVRTGERQLTDELRVMFLNCSDVINHFITALSADHNAQVEYTDPLASLSQDTPAAAPPSQTAPQTGTGNQTIPQCSNLFTSEEDANKILIVDDEQGILDLLGDSVADLGYEPVCCLNGKAAVEHLIHGMRPTAALVDLAMPGMDGLELTKRILECDPTIAVVMCSGFAGKQDVAQFLNMGAFGYMDKPARHFELTLMINNAVKATKLRRLSRDLAHMNLQTFRDLIKVTSTILGESNDPELKRQVKELEEQFAAIGKITRALSVA